MTQTQTQLETALQTLQPEHLKIEDKSTLHAGHAGNTGGGHYNVFIVSPLFEGLSLVQRHKLVYDAVGELMTTAIHALSIQAKTPAEIGL